MTVCVPGGQSTSPEPFLNTKSSNNPANTSWHTSVTSRHIIPSLEGLQRDPGEAQDSMFEVEKK